MLRISYVYEVIFTPFMRTVFGDAKALLSFYICVGHYSKCSQTSMFACIFMVQTLSAESLLHKTSAGSREV